MCWFQSKRNKHAALKLMRKLLKKYAFVPERLVTDDLRSYTAAGRELGFANDWHFAHLGARAVGGAGLVFTEAAAVAPEGRISPQDLGVWSEKHFEPLERIVRFIDSQGARAGVQLAHAGRKGSTYRPGAGNGAIPEASGGWRPLAPSAVAFSDSFPMPAEMTVDQIHAVQDAFAIAAGRAF